jgi:hypothetical protein
MTRIFLTLATLDGLALAVTFLVGVVSMLRRSAQDPADPTYLIHFHLGLYTVIATLGVHCMIFIYFLGTGRWVKEACLAYDLPDARWPRLTRELKRATFPPALAAMLIAIATAAAGQAGQMRLWPWYVHGTLAVATLVVNLWAFGIEYRNVLVNLGAIDEVVRETDRIRAERGLPSSAEALRQQG